MYQPPPGAAVLEATRGRYTQRLSRAQALHFTKITYKCALALGHGLRFDVPGVSQRQLARGWEVRVNGLPQPRPYPPALQEYLTDAKLFRKYNKKPGFQSGRIEFDYSKVRRV
jgi:hypothetical protein